MPPERFPEVELTTDRLRLRAFTAADTDDVYRAVSDPSSQEWLPMPAPGVRYTRDHAALWCREEARHALAVGDGIHWAAEEVAGGGFVGSFGLVRTLWASRCTEVGYWCAPGARGRGYATEAVTEIAHWALIGQGFERVELKAATGNTASRRVAEKAGFVREGVERNAMPLHRGRTDLVVYSLIPRDLP
ncbi:GNAT family N-acetyltransferase [Allonocardiopsis opalescens]|uniref:RimJ/RimL family protein N-acetyltransferase n=1 Tax=Allonocardiopsis opalescens TaxID=1144618 RepID=A0A2T0PXJ8_9ACTN|nr:GNAT family N-acetyltransferase [Allonocardiopsis opalescens]PRX96264.1 RimJ/RimL family protein N-acetyltransferase [Allonocardiopsis opalescens]